METFKQFLPYMGMVANMVNEVCPFEQTLSLPSKVHIKLVKIAPEVSEAKWEIQFWL